MRTPGQWRELRRSMHDSQVARLEQAIDLNIDSSASGVIKVLVSEDIDEPVVIDIMGRYTKAGWDLELEFEHNKVNGEMAQWLRMWPADETEE